MLSTTEFAVLNFLKVVSIEIAYIGRNLLNFVAKQRSIFMLRSVVRVIFFYVCVCHNGQHKL